MNSINTEVNSDVFESINPFTQGVLARHRVLPNDELMDTVNKADKAFSRWRNSSHEERSHLMTTLASVLRANSEELARMAAREMGKPITEAVAEINKSAQACDYYAKHAEIFLSPEVIETEADYSAIHNDPLGVILAIMPWNYPYWQVIRCVVPALCAGNTVLVKHAPNVQSCANLLMKMMYEAGFPNDVVQSVTVRNEDVKDIIAHPAIQAVSLTGSERAGMSVASIAGTYLKKCVLELGGSNAYVIWDDADIQLALDIAVPARMLNNGQSCLAAKRFIVHKNLVEEFTEGLKEQVQMLIVGNPIVSETQIGPLARVDLAIRLEEQVQTSIEQGAVLICGGKRSGALFTPTVLTNVKPGMPVFKEETFGPVACITTAESNDQAIALGKDTAFGLGMAIFTSNISKAKEYIAEIADGTVAINSIIKSDARLPFGGTRRSGYGRELSRDGILEFVNRKTVVIQNHPK